MILDQEMRLRIRNTLYSPARFQRIAHFLFAQILFVLPDALRLKLFGGESHYCPVCQHHLRTFLTLHRPYRAWCPMCWSLQRHRFVWRFFQQHTNLFDPQPKRVLHLAPEPAFAARFQQLPQLDYLSADLHNPAAMVKMDICNIQYPAHTFDVIYCSHVLEHVPDDHTAIGELHRVLKPNGWAVILVPIVGAVTVEDPTVTSPMERERLFGQHDHVRCYGRDFTARLEDAGFTVWQVGVDDVIRPDDRHRLGVSLDDSIFFCTK